MLTVETETPTPTRFLNYTTPSGRLPDSHLPGKPWVTPRPFGPDSFGGLWRFVTVERTETGFRLGLLPHVGTWPEAPDAE